MMCLCEGPAAPSVLVEKCRRGRVGAQSVGLFPVPGAKRALNSSSSIHWQARLESKACDFHFPNTW